MKDKPACPPIAQISRALVKTTEGLAREFSCPTTVAPKWNEFEWRIARAVAAMHGVSTVVRSSLRWKGPVGWKLFLDEQEHHSQRRHRLISDVLRQINEGCRREGVALVALKGAALHSLELYKAGQRPMGDVDLLIRQEDGDAVARVLDHCGYELAFVSRRHITFQPKLRNEAPTVSLGEHIDSPLKIELHTRVAEEFPRVDITRYMLPHPALDGINGYPSFAALMMHLLLHAAGNMRARALRLIQLYDIALLAARFVQRDWEDLAATRFDGRAPWWALAPLLLTERYYPHTVPQTLLASLNSDCPKWLANSARRQLLADVSWSNMRIAAFPGIEWSQNFVDALRLVRGRIWPTPIALSELEIGAAQIPGQTSIPWYGLSHGVRIMRWIVSRPPRVQTLLSVRAALAQDV